MNHLPDFSKHQYQTIRQLGCNAEGGRITYLATDLTSNKKVVIKEFRFASNLASWSGFKAYQREILVLQKLKHPRIPRYLKSFETPAGFCLVQEYKNAPSLAESSNFTENEIKKIASSILQILAYIQKRYPPVIHRDIKPENILVDAEYNAYLVDFGLAKIRGQNVAVSSIAAGTPGFMPPEEMFNRPLSEASDLYSLGATLICLLTDTSSIDIGQLIDENYRFNFKKHLKHKVNGKFIWWLEKMVEPNVKNRFPNAATALESLKLTAPVFPIFNNTGFLAQLVFFVGGWLILISLVITFSKELFVDSLPKESQTGTSVRGAKYYRQGRHLLNNDRYSEALNAYDRALKINPNYEEAYDGGCWALYRLKDYNKALYYCDKAVEIKPDYYQAWRHRGSVLNRLGRYQEALESNDISIEFAPEYYPAWNGRCWALNNLQRYREALKGCDRAIEIKPDYEWAWNNRGRALEGMGRYWEAIASYGRAIEINPNNQTAIKNRKRLEDK